MQGAVQMQLETSNKSKAVLSQLGSSTVRKVNLNRVGGLPVSQLVPVFGKHGRALRMRIIPDAVPISVCLSSRLWPGMIHLGVTLAGQRCSGIPLGWQGEMDMAIGQSICSSVSLLALGLMSVRQPGVCQDGPWLKFQSLLNHKNFGSYAVTNIIQELHHY